MGLEDLVKSVLAPVEKLAAKVYSAMPKVVQKGLDYVKGGYVTLRDALVDYVCKPMDTYFINPVDKYLISPTADLITGVAKASIGKHPYLTGVGTVGLVGLLAIAL